MRAVCLLLLAACAPPVPVTLVPGATTQSVLIAELDSAQRIVRLRAHPREPLTRLEIDQTDATDLRVLEYDESFAELGIVVGQDGLVEVMPSRATPDEAWALGTPARLSLLRGMAETFEQVAADDPWIRTFLVRRPPCRSSSEYRRVVTPYDERGVNMTVAFGDHVLVGFGSIPIDVATTDRSPRLYRVHSVTGELEELSGQPSLPITHTAVFGPRGFVDGDQAWILWGDGASQSSHTLVPLRPDGTIGTPVEVTLDAAITGFDIEAVVAGRFGGERTLVGLTRGGQLIHFDEARRHWRVVATNMSDEVCSGHTSRYVLEVDGPGRGWVGLREGPIVRFDLSRAEGDQLIRASELVPGAPFCRNLRVKLDSGLDVMSLQLRTGFLYPIELAWRLPEGEWQRRTNNDLLSQGLAPINGGFVISGSADTVVFHEHSARHPELPPRQCGSTAVAGSAVYNLVRAGPSTVFVGGTRGGGFVAYDE